MITFNFSGKFHLIIREILKVISYFDNRNLKKAQKLWIEVEKVRARQIHPDDVEVYTQYVENLKEQILTITNSKKKITHLEKPSGLFYKSNSDDLQNTSILNFTTKRSLIDISIGFPSLKLDGYRSGWKTKMGYMFS